MLKNSNISSDALHNKKGAGLKQAGPSLNESKRAIGIYFVMAVSSISKTRKASAGITPPTPEEP